MSDARQQIENLFYTYANGIDDGKLAVTASLFRHGAIYDGNDNCLAQGEDEALAFYQRIIKIYPESKTPKTQHVITNVLLHEEQDGIIECTANYTVFQEIQRHTIATIICGQYQSTFKESAGRWHFHTHKTYPRIIGDLSKHLQVSISNIRKEQRTNEEKS